MTPHVIPIEVPIDRRGGRGVTIKCPFCERTHTHGWPIGDTDPPGHRVAHCLQGNGNGYYIDAPVE